MTKRIATIVEGHGEQRALPILLRRIAAEIIPNQTILVDSNPWRIPRGSLLQNDGHLKQALDTLAISVKNQGGIIILFDSDDDCPATFAPNQARRIAGLRNDLMTSVVMANWEFEAWFLAAAASCAGKGGLSPHLADHPDPESPRDCKGWLSQNMPAHSGYQETLHQELFSRLIDINRVRARSASFDKLCREVTRIAES